MGRETVEMPMRRRGTGLTALHRPFLHLLSGPIQIQGSLAEFHKMIVHKTGWYHAPFYDTYGCHCGLGDSGYPADETDW